MSSKPVGIPIFFAVSMKSGLEDRNNPQEADRVAAALRVSMKSGLEDRNNEDR